MTIGWIQLNGGWPQARSIQWPIFTVVSIRKDLCISLKNFANNLLDHMTIFEWVDVFECVEWLFQLQVYWFPGGTWQTHIGGRDEETGARRNARCVL
jgi:hypothetical protein